MFFIMGGGQGQKKLDFDQLVVCPGCGKYGHLEVYMVYSYLSLFFIPLFKWGRCYHVRTTCCGRSVAISPELGRAIETGEIKSLPEDIIPAGYDYGSQGYGRPCWRSGRRRWHGRSDHSFRETVQSLRL